MSPRCSGRRLTIPIVALLFLFSASSAEGGAFSDIPGVTEFERSLEDSTMGADGRIYELYELLGATRCVTTGDYDQDGDEDVITTRFAHEFAGPGDEQPQFVLYENLLKDATKATENAGPGSNRVRFRVRPHALGWFLRDMFPNVPASWPDTLPRSFLPALVTADFNGDGWPDVLVGGSRLELDAQPNVIVIDRSLLYINCRSGFTFQERGREAGITDGDRLCLGATVADYNNDGRVDIFLAAGDLGGCGAGTGAPNMLFISSPPGSVDPTFTYGGQTISHPTFTSASNSAWNFLRGGSAAADSVHHFNPTSADFDRDGWIDLYVGWRARCGGGAGVECEETLNQLLHNRGGASQDGFEDLGPTLGVADNGNAYGAAWGDFDNDQDLDLVLANNIHDKDFPCPPTKVLHSKLWRNGLAMITVPAPFEEISVPDFLTEAGTQTNNGAFFFDYNLDGLQDFYFAVHSAGDGNSSNPLGNTLYKQTAPGVFQEAALSEGVTKQVSILHPTDSCTPPFYTSRVPDGSNSIYADFDQDGDLDLFVPSAYGNRSACYLDQGGWTMVYQNTTRSPAGSGTSNWISVRLRGTSPATAGAWGADWDAIGSVARVYAGGKVWSQQVCAGGQDGSTWPFELTFGLGAASTIDSIVVDWHHAKADGTANTPYHHRIDGPIAVNQRYPVIVMPSVVRVPNDNTSLQNAINNASAGSVVLVQVASGIVGPFTLKSGVRVEAVGSQVIDAAGASTGVTMSAANNNAGTALVGFTIKNVNGSAVHITGGGSQPVTVENCTIEGSAYATRNGVVSSSTSVRVVNCAFVGPSAKGVQLGVDFWDTGTKSLFVSGCRFSNVDLTGVSRAIHVSAGSGPVHVEGNTAWNYEYGVEVVAGTTGAVFRKNLFAIGTYAGVGIFGNPPSTNNVVENNNCWGFIYNYSVNGYHGTIPPGNLSADPVFCSTTDLTLNLTSPCARANNAGGAWIGARPYVSCMSGELTASWDVQTADINGSEIAMPGDLKVPSGKTLAVRPLITIKASATPSGANLGGDASKVEMLVDGGGLETKATLLGAGVEFISGAASPTPSDWYGIRVKGGGKAFLTKTNIRHCKYGLHAESGADTVEIEGGVISLNATGGIRAENDSTGVTTDLVIKGTLVDLSSPATAATGIHASGIQSALIDGVEVHGRVDAVYGIYLGAPGTGGSSPDVWQATVEDLYAGSGVYVAGGDALLRGCILTGNKWGSNFQGTGSPCLLPLSEGDRVGETLISGCTTGSYINVASGKPQIAGGTIAAGTTSGVIGLYTEGAQTGAYKNLTISGGYTAVKANSQGPDTLMNSCVTGFASVGVQVMNAGQIVLGGVSSRANNLYSSVSGVSKYVTVKTPRVSGTPDVDAQYNWWGESPAPSTKLSNYVNYVNALTGPVSCAGSRAFTMNREVPLMRPFAVHPNPSTNQVVMSFSVPVGLQVPVELRVFDVSGRLVRTLLNERLTPGSVEARWDGKDGAGRVMPGGLFFARLKVGTEIQTRKMIRLSR